MKSDLHFLPSLRFLASCLTSAIRPALQAILAALAVAGVWLVSQL